MDDSTLSEDNDATGELSPVLAGLRLAEEHACSGYLAARKAQVRLGARVVSLNRLLVEQPRRADYRDALAELIDRYRAAKERTRLAYAGWERARHRYDLMWQDTEGRKPHPATSTAVVDTDGEVA